MQGPHAMHDARMRVEVLIGFDADKPEDAIDPFCDHLRSVLPRCEDIEIISLNVTGEVADPLARVKTGRACFRASNYGEV